MFNHIPIVGLGFALLLNLAALLKNDSEWMKLSFWGYIAIAILAILPVTTGDGAGEIALTYPGITEEAIENHETWAYAFFWGLIALGVLSVAGFWLSAKNKLPLKKSGTIVVFLAVLLMGLAYQVGSSAGKIRHPEIEQGVYKGSCCDPSNTR